VLMWECRECFTGSQRRGVRAQVGQLAQSVNLREISCQKIKILGGG
jgi:hypothetical protein